MSSFFTAPTNQRKRRRNEASTSSAPKKRHITSSARKPSASSQKAREVEDESITGSESSASIAASDQEDDSGASSGEEHQTAAERRLKLAEQYLENIRAEVGGDEAQEVGFDAEDIDRDLIAARLKEDVAEGKGRVYRYIAAQLDYSGASQSFIGADAAATTGVAACSPYLYTVSKDMRLIKWRLADSTSVRAAKAKRGERVARRKSPKQLIHTRGNKKKKGDSSYKHHTAPILCVAASADGKFVATSGVDRRLIIWDAATLEPLKVFTQHRDSVLALAFRGKTNQLFSASKDRTVKIWSLDELAYVETLFGHQDEVVDVAAVGGSQERCVSVGARDRTARLWKVVEESQLVFRGGGTAAGGMKDTTTNGHITGSTNGDSASAVSNKNVASSAPAFAEGSLDRVTQLDTQLFVTGSDSGALSLFSLHKKKPLHVYPLAHGFDPPLPLEETSADNQPRQHSGVQPTPRWITALKAIPYTDLFVSGSWDGCVKVWRITNEDGPNPGPRKIELVGVLGDEKLGASPGLVNGSEEIVNGGAFDSREGGLAGRRIIRGVVNDLAVFERGDRGADGLQVIAAVGRQTRLGHWRKMKAKNGAVVFEIPKQMTEPSQD